MGQVMSIRGAITTENNEDDILSDTRELLFSLLNQNSIDIEDIITIQFTTTSDLDAVYPAKAAREMGIVSAGLVCVSEMTVVNSLKQCIRVNILVNGNQKQSAAVHVYLKGAKILRPDLILMLD